MKIKLPFHYQLKINKQYKPLKSILPIGCDCHPAYMISKLELRNESLPLDWLDTKPSLALYYAFINIKDNFSDFLIDLKKNEKGKVFAEKYPEALFYHFDDLIENVQLQNKIRQRIARFLELRSSKSCYYLHTLPSSGIATTENLEFVKESIVDFQSLLKNNDELIIYLRFDESFEEHKEKAKLLQDFADSLSQVRLIKYLRFKDKFGIWGDESQYKKLMHELGIKTKFSGLKINIEKLKKATK